VDLVPPEGILGAAAAFGYGAGKYGSWNWAKGLAWLRLYGACLRHLFAWVGGERADPESGLSHLDHALASLMMLKAHEVRGLGMDDRPAAPAQKLVEVSQSTIRPSYPENWRINAFDDPDSSDPNRLLDRIR
jgi:hypothetical protein